MNSQLREKIQIDALDERTNDILNTTNIWVKQQQEFNII